MVLWLLVVLIVIMVTSDYLGSNGYRHVFSYHGSFGYHDSYTYVHMLALQA